MKFYRVHYRIDGGNSAGSHWFTTKRAARAALLQGIKIRTQEARELYARDVETAELPDEIEEIVITPTKQGILAALNTYAAHPDNG